MFNPHKGRCKADTEGGSIVFTYMSYFLLGNVYWTFNLQPVFCLFETMKMFYPPKGRLLTDSSRGPIVFTYVLFCLRKRILGFQFNGGF